MAVIFKFKKGPRPTGLSSIANPYAFVDIRRNEKQVGSINPPSRFGRDFWQVGFMVKQEATEAHPCPWRWVFFKTQHETEAAARAWVKDNAAAIAAKLDLRDDDA